MRNEPLDRPGGAPWVGRSRAGRVLLGLALLMVAGQAGRAQLAITEVMSWAATNCLGGRTTNNADWWELTNYGTNTLLLNGYRFADRGKEHTFAVPLDGIRIEGGESIVFVRTNKGTVDGAAFSNWWGTANLPARPLQIHFYPSGYGFDDRGDAALLWDPQTNLVDEAVFGEATLGVTFTTDACGRFGEPSRLGVAGAFRAVECEDVGSPGFAPPLVPLSITQPPVSQTVDGGAEATFRVRVCGLPRPRGYTWYHNGLPIAGARTTAFAFPLVVNYAGCGLAWTTNTEPSDLVIPSVQPARAGQYYVVVTNGVQCVTSAVVTLTVSTNPSPPRLEWPPADLWFPLVAGRPQTNLVVTPWQTANFAVLLRGYPVPTLQWSWSEDGTNFVNLPLATNHTLSVPYVQPSHAGVYRVRAQNSRGVTNAYARLTVKAKPRLKITEAMCQQNNPIRNDWWELTNVGDEPVDLYGYRWDDWPGNIGGGATVNRPVLLQPGESVLFVESTAPEVFRRWWGADNLPANLQFIIYGANGLAGDGDEITLWNPTATDDWDFIDSVGFSTATRGASFWFEPDDPCSEFGVLSVAGQCGAWSAAEDGDVASPGWSARTGPSLLRVEHMGSFALVWWRAQPGSTNRLQHTSRLATPPSATAWTTLGTYCFPGATGAEIDFNLNGVPQRFYRVVRDAPCPCPCEMPFAIFPDGPFFWTADPARDPNPAD